MEIKQFREKLIDRNVNRLFSYELGRLSVQFRGFDGADVRIAKVMDATFSRVEEESGMWSSIPNEFAEGGRSKEVQQLINGEQQESIPSASHSQLGRGHRHGGRSWPVVWLGSDIACSVSRMSGFL